MARSKINPTSSVTFRMQEVTLRKIDKLAAENNHDRTTEINDACRYWIELGGSTSQETVFTLQKQIASLEKNMAEMADSLRKLEENNSTLLHIIEKITGK